jgi:hypothetical protein
MLNGEIIFIPVDLRELFHQFQLPEDACMIGQKAHLIHPFPAGVKEAVGLDQLANAVKSYFVFEVFRVGQSALFCLSKVIKKASSL